MPVLRREDGLAAGKRGRGMKIFYLECTRDELAVNRGIMDSIVDACSGLLNGLYGSYTPATNDDEDGEESEENK